MQYLQSYSSSGSWFDEQSEGIYNSNPSEETEVYLGYSTQERTRLSSEIEKLLTSNRVEDIMSIVDLSLEENEIENLSVHTFSPSGKDPHNNQPIHSDSMEIETMPKKPYKNLNPKVIKKAPYNFGQRALNFMIMLITDNHYDEFIARKFNKDKFYIREFKHFCLKVHYSGIKDFRKIWKCTKLIGEQENDFYVILRKITQKFLKREVWEWMRRPTIHKEIIPYYEKCIKLYLEGIRNPQDFSFSEYDY